MDTSSTSLKFLTNTVENNTNRVENIPMDFFKDCTDNELNMWLLVQPLKNFEERHITYEVDKRRYIVMVHARCFEPKDAQPIEVRHSLPVPLTVDIDQLKVRFMEHEQLVILTAPFLPERQPRNLTKRVNMWRQRTLEPCMKSLRWIRNSNEEMKTLFNELGQIIPANSCPRLLNIDLVYPKYQEPEMWRVPRPDNEQEQLSSITTNKTGCPVTLEFEFDMFGIQRDDIKVAIVDNNKALMFTSNYENKMEKRVVKVDMFGKLLLPSTVVCKTDKLRVFFDNCGIMRVHIPCQFKDNEVFTKGVSIPVNRV